MEEEILEEFEECDTPEGRKRIHEALNKLADEGDEDQIEKIVGLLNKNNQHISNEIGQANSQPGQKGANYKFWNLLPWKDWGATEEEISGYRGKAFSFKRKNHTRRLVTDDDTPPDLINPPLSKKLENEPGFSISISIGQTNTLPSRPSLLRMFE